MNRTVVTSVSVTAVAAIICVYLFASGQRYATINAGDGAVYKVDRRTGNAMIIVGSTEIPVEPPSAPRSDSVEDRAIRPAKEGHTLKPDDYTLNNDFHIRAWIKTQTGDLRVIGWKASRIDDQTLLATYSIKQNSAVRNWVFEVQPDAELVRNVSGDAELEKKYESALSSTGVSR
jgi:hypothetical protein